jgi:phosphoenolpyruvate carboxylase
MFLLVIFYLLNQFSQEEKAFQKKMDSLQKTIAECNQKQLRQSHQVQLNDELEQTLKTNKVTLSHAVFNLNYDLFELLSQNNLLKKRK